MCCFVFFSRVCISVAWLVSIRQCGSVATCATFSFVRCPVGGTAHLKVLLVLLALAGSFMVNMPKQFMLGLRLFKKLFGPPFMAMIPHDGGSS